MNYAQIISQMKWKHFGRKKNEHKLSTIDFENNTENA